MSEETTNAATEATSSERAGYCQDCGKPLTRETVRVVGTGVFCEPCLATRIGAVPTGYAASAEAGPRPAASPPGASQPGGNGWSAPRNPAGSGYPGGAGYPGAPGNPGGPGGPGAPGGLGAGFTPSPSTHLPNPTLAGLLGIIPGVGAMYNGQLVKGLLHLAIFAILVVLQNNVSGIFGLFVASWIFYQIFDAYHTARARRDGTPLPNLFGINDLADRIGSGQGFSTHPGAPGQAPGSGPAGYGYAAPTSPVPPPPSAAAWDWKSAAAPPYVPTPPTVPQSSSSYGVPPANWAGYAHPSTFAVPSPPPPVPGYTSYTGPSPAETAEQIKAQAYRDAGLSGTPYTETPAGTGGSLAGYPPIPLTPAPRRFPMGALWLIALGVLVLVGNLSSEWRISGLWVLAGLFASLAVWTLVRRLEWAGGYSAVLDGHFPRLAGMLRAPIMLLTLSVMFLLQAAHLATFGQTWPVFPIAFGVALLLERTVGAAPIVPLPPVSGFYGATANAAPAPVVPAAEPTSSNSTDVRS